jgi:hypothetical protein
MFMALHWLRRVVLGVGASLAAFGYFDPGMRTEDSVRIALGVGLVAFALPGIPRGRPRRPKKARRGFEVVVPEGRAD